MNSRRTFVITAVSCGSAIATGLMTGNAVAQAKLDEKDPQAVGLGYVADTTKADKKKYAKHANDQKCTNCALFQGKATDAAGGCPLFAGKQVAGPGWCSAWAKKA
jgi:High potential iron-sulfur protein